MSAHEQPGTESNWAIPEDLRLQILAALATGPQGTAAPKMTYEEFLAWADEDTRAEWIDGEVIMASPASLQHQLLAEFLQTTLGTYVRARGLGIVLAAPFQMKLERSGREPDLLFVANEHRDWLRETYLDGPADLAVEILSQESIGRDRGDKYYEYAQGGVPEYWLIDPQAEWAEFYRLAEGRYRQAFEGREGDYRSRAVPGFWLRVGWLWQRPLPDPLRVFAEIAGLDGQLINRFLKELGGR